MTATRTTNAAALRLPDGFAIVLDPDTRRIAPDVLVGGSPTRMLRLLPAGQAALTQLERRRVDSPTTGHLARRLTDAGVAHPLPPAVTVDARDVTVIIPVRDRADMLTRCLEALSGGHRVLVVDDGSRDAHRLAAVCAEHDVTLVRREHNGGPAAARNTGLAHLAGEHLTGGQADSRFVAFLDSDCVPSPGWLDALAAHLADPLVGAAAPRILALPAPGSASRFAQAHGCLDLGERPARVAPRTRISYVPTAALLVRRSALAELAREDAVFDPDLRYGEDVDLIWRLHDAGWRIRYDPTVRVLHEEPATWTGLLVRRFRYGTSAAPLASRHRGALAPLVLHPWAAFAVAGVLWRRPAATVLGLGGVVIGSCRTVRALTMPARTVVPSTLEAVQQTALGVGRFAVQFASPLLLASLVAGGKRTWGRRLATVALAVAPPLHTWVRRRPDLDPLRFTLGHLADDLAYGSGVWVGAVHARTSAPLRPQLMWRSRPASCAAPAGPPDSDPPLTTAAPTPTPTRTP